MKTREELEAQAIELGITFPATIKDETLAKKIEVALKEEATDKSGPIATPKAIGANTDKVVAMTHSSYERGEFKSGNATIIRN